MTSLDHPHDESGIREQFAAAQCPGVTEGSCYFTTSQQAAMGRLDALAEVFERMADAKPGGFDALTKPLIIGQTGSSKSTLVREFARLHGWSYLAIDGGSWTIRGAYSKPPTLQVVRDHIRSV